MSSSIDPSLSVFVNCPFDDEFRPLLDATVLSVSCCGFFPRSALEGGVSNESRVSRVIETIRKSRYSIHDLSRCMGEGPENLARFNMPLELGIAMGRHFYQSTEHEWLVLAPAVHVHVPFISDLRAWDLASHDGSERSIVAAIVPWLGDRQGIKTTPRTVLAKLDRFKQGRKDLEAEYLGTPPWVELVTLAMSLA